VVWNTSRSGTTAATLGDLEDRDRGELCARRFIDFMSGREKDGSKRVEAALQERSVSGKGEGI
jgi:hypothetical protein